MALMEKANVCGHRGWCGRRGGDFSSLRASSRHYFALSMKSGLSVQTLKGRHGFYHGYHLALALSRISFDCLVREVLLLAVQV